MNQKDELIQRMKKWLEDPKHGAAEMAAKLGYKSSVTVSFWMKQERIPKWQRNNVIRVLKENQ
jgi:hypothetical protein